MTRTVHIHLRDYPAWIGPFIVIFTSIMYLCMPSPGRPLARREFRSSGVSFFSGANTRPCKTKKKKTNVSRSYVFAGAKSRARSSYFTAYCVVIQSAARSLFDDVLLIAVGQLWGAYTRARIQSKQE